MKEVALLQAQLVEKAAPIFAAEGSPARMIRRAMIQTLECAKRVELEHQFQKVPTPFPQPHLKLVRRKGMTAAKDSESVAAEQSV